MKHPVAKLECLACGHNVYEMRAKAVGDLIPESCAKCGGDMVITARDELPQQLEEIGNLVEELFHIWDFNMTPERIEFLVEPNSLRESFSDLLSRLREIGYIGRMEEQDGETSLIINKVQAIEKENVFVNVALLIATIGTTFGVAGYYFLYHDIVHATLFSGSLMTILGAHEMGHKFAAWRQRVEATWPYFLPVPHPYIGTLGAVIRTKSPIPTKEGLVEVGASGPVLGFIFALPFAVLGLILSEPTGGAIMFGGEPIFELIPAPLVFALLGNLIFDHFPTNLWPHPFAWASFIGLLVTWLNLMPAGHLDGGHVARGFLNKRNHYLLTRAFGFGLILLAFLWPPFLIWGILILFLFGKPHQGALNNVSKLRGKQKKLAIVALGVFVLTLPIPASIF